MLIKLLFFIFLMPYTSLLWAINCYVTLAKDSCWKDYNVKVTLINVATEQVITTVTAAKGKTWAREMFVCEPSLTLRFTSEFDPVFWQEDKGKVFVSKSYMALPSTYKKGDSAWNVPLCFASDFSQIPLPPTGSGHCVCNTSDIPPIPPEKIK